MLICPSQASTVFDAQDLGYRVILVEDACKGINPEKVEETMTRIKENNGLVINSKEVIKWTCHVLILQCGLCMAFLGKIAGQGKWQKAWIGN